MTTEIRTSPSAERNKGPILEILRSLLPPHALVLEIASGTGQHVVHFAAQLPQSAWQPSERDTGGCESLALRVRREGTPNIRPPMIVDVQQSPWPLPAEFDAVLAINMIHITPFDATRGLFRGARQVLRADGAGLVVTYGPYREAGIHTAESNAAFDAGLRAQHPDWGVRDLAEVDEVAAGHGFGRGATFRMPANNLTLVYRGA